MLFQTCLLLHLFTGHLLVAHLFRNTFSFLAFCWPFFCFDSARVRPHKATGEPQEYNAKVYSAYLELQAVPGQAIDAAAWPRRGASYPFPGSLPRPALLILLTWIFTSHKPIFGRGQAFCVAT